jgi:hypothetical protein
MITCGVTCAVLVASSLATLAQAPAAKRSGPSDQNSSAKVDPKKPARPLGPGGIGGRGAITPVTLVQNPAVQKELGITPDQNKKIAQLNEQFNKTRRESAQALAKGGGAINTGEVMAMIAQLREQHETAIAKLLEPKQRKRLSEIALQLEGPLAVSRPEIAAKINMRPEQVELVQELIRAYSESADRLFRDHDQRLQAIRDRGVQTVEGRGGGAAKADRPGGTAAPKNAGEPASVKANDAEVARFRNDADSALAAVIKQVGKVLSQRQKETFNRLLGEPFDLAAVRPSPNPSPGRPGEGFSFFSDAQGAGTSAGKASAEQSSDESQIILEPIPPKAQPPQGSPKKSADKPPKSN